jgi:SWIM zinc finger
MAVEHLYRYLEQSTVTPADGLGLATAGGRVANPHFFRGFIERADQGARALLAIAEVARTRYFDATAMTLARDPVVSSNRSVLRFESFSACNGVYARFDLDSDGMDVAWSDWGTTNVDVNEPLRAALSMVGSGDPLRLSIGAEELTVTTLEGSIVEKKVPLPDRWLKGFAEVQIAASGMVRIVDVGAAAARAAIRDLPTQRTGNQPMWVSFSASGARLTQRPTADTPCLVAPQRLSALRRLAPFISGLTIYAPPMRARRGSTGASVVLQPSVWVVHLTNARVTLVVSPEIYRGFSGEGAVLDALASVNDIAVAQVGEHLEGQARLDAATLSAATGASVSSVVDSLSVLGAAGRIGFDLHTDGFFHRDLPFDRSALEGMQPRLRNARELFDAGSVTLQKDRALVQSDEAAYSVRFTDDGLTCTCPWFAKHRGERGACKHALAAQLARNAAERTA